MNATNDLSRKESTVLTLVAQGRRNAEIAEELYLSIHTVESHLHHIFKKLDVASRTEAAVYALDLGLLANPKKINGNTHDAEFQKNYYRVIT